MLLGHLYIAFSVSVYVMLHQRSPHVLCVDQQLRNAELIDPAFQWHGPKGKIISGRILFQLYGNRSVLIILSEENICIP